MITHETGIPIDLDIPEGALDRWSDKPETERILFYLQDKWLADHDEATMVLLMRILENYARSLTIKFVKRTGIPIQISVREYSRDIGRTASLKVLNSYLSRNFQVGGSFAGTLFHKIRESAFGDAQEEQIPSYDALLGDLHEQESSGLDLGATMQIRGAFDFESRVLSDDDARSLVRRVRSALHAVADAVVDTASAQELRDMIIAGEVENVDTPELTAKALSAVDRDFRKSIASRLHGLNALVHYMRYRGQTSVEAYQDAHPEYATTTMDFITTAHDRLGGF